MKTVLALAKGDRLDTFNEVYGERETPPELLVPLKGSVVPEKGERVLVEDQNGNKVEAVVERLVVAIRPDYSTYRMRGQTGLDL